MVKETEAQKGEVKFRARGVLVTRTGTQLRFPFPQASLPRLLGSQAVSETSRAHVGNWAHMSSHPWESCSPELGPSQLLAASRTG